MDCGAALPVLRIVFDIAKAGAFHLDYPGLRVDFEHRFDASVLKQTEVPPSTRPGRVKTGIRRQCRNTSAPLYMGVSRDTCRLHVSEHYGDASPGAHVRNPVTGIDALHRDLTVKAHPGCRPGIETMPWGRDMGVTGPFANRLVFFAAT